MQKRAIPIFYMSVIFLILTGLATAGVFADAISNVVVRHFGAHEIDPQGQEVESASTCNGYLGHPFEKKSL